MKLVMQPETDVGSELLLTSFDVTHHGQSTSHPDIRERVRESKTESLKPLTKMHFVIKMWTFFMHNKYKGFEQLCERGLFCIKNVFFPAYIWDLLTLIVIRKTKGGSDSSSVSVVAMC